MQDGGQIEAEAANARVADATDDATNDATDDMDADARDDAEADATDRFNQISSLLYDPCSDRTPSDPQQSEVNFSRR